MKKLLLALIIMIFAFSCGIRHPRWIQEGMDPTHAVYDTLNIRDIKVNALPVITSRDTLIAGFGVPDKITQDGGKFFRSETGYKNPESRKENEISFAAYFYPNLRFAVWGDQVRLNEIDFRNSDLEIRTSMGTFSNKTKEKELEKLFPESFYWSRSGVCGMSGYPSIKRQDLENGRINWIFLHNGVGENRRIELVFIDRKLAYAFFDNVE